MRSLQEIKQANTEAQIAGFKARFVRAKELMPNGFTIDALGHVVDRDYGCAVAIRSFDSLESLVNSFAGLFANPDSIDFFFGYWKDPAGQEYFEATRIYEDLDVATAVAQDFSQLAIYDFQLKKDIYV